MTHVTCRLTAKNRDQLRNPRSAIECGLSLLFCEVIGSLAFNAALALLVVSRRTRVSGKCTRGNVPGNVCSGEDMSVPSVLVWSTELVDDRIRVCTYDGRARRGLMHRVYYTLATVTKKCAD